MQEDTRPNAVTLYSIFSPRVDCCVLLKEFVTLNFLLHFEYEFFCAIIFSNIISTGMCGYVAVSRPTTIFIFGQRRQYSSLYRSDEIGRFRTFDSMRISSLVLFTLCAIQIPVSGQTDKPTFTTGEPNKNTGEPTSVTDEPTSVTGEPTSVTGEPTSVTGELTSVTDEPNYFTGEPTSVTGGPTATGGPGTTG